MDTNDRPFAHLEPYSLPTGCGLILLSVAFFKIASKIGTHIDAPQSVDKNIVWKFRNLRISWLHAVIVGIWDLICFYNNPEMFEDLIEHFTFSSYFMVAFSTGYFIYDFFEIIAEKRVIGSWEVFCHHIVIITIFGANVLQCRYIAFNVIALLAEVNSVFLHFRKLMQMSKVDYTSFLYRINVFLNLATLVFGRFGGLVAIFYGIYHWHHRAHKLYTVALIFTCSSLVVLNIVLFARLIRSDLLRGINKKKHINSDATLVNGKGSHHVNNNLSKSD